MTPAQQEHYRLTLFVSGRSSRSIRTIANLRRICRELLEDRHELEVVDVCDQPERAEAEKILLTPTLVRQEPSPRRRIVGDLSDLDTVLYGLDLVPEREQRGELTRE